MNTMYRGIPHKTIEEKAIRFVGNTYREAMMTAKRKGAKGDPILCMSKSSMTIVYYPSAELHQMAIEMQAQKQAEKAAIQAERERPTVLTYVRDMMAQKIKTQSRFERPSF
ncbi:hypothetical protein I5730_14645 [Acinetobacter nosocomialis]|uniref:hypothetical protein n=1 Tax=Acinetobacter TaxID=469 RepID=UPI0018FF7CA9|nr:hypothetical protein [Acinetobacter nosocomialis]MBJ9961779.1 hypothetical protein [Acinetobacter nosocomialis]